VKVKRPVALDYTRACIVGRTRQGKTYLVKYLLERIQDWLVLDVCDEYADIALQTYRDQPWEQVKRDILDCFIAGDKVQAVYVPNEDEEDILDKVSELCLEIGAMTLVVDEAHEWITSSAIPPKFRRLTRRGAKLGCKIIAVSQRHTDLNTNYVSQCDLVISFQQLLKRDIEYLEKYAEVPNLSMLRDLEQGQYIMIVRGQVV